MGTAGGKPPEQFTGDGERGMHVQEGAMLVQGFHKTAHVRTAHIMRQINRQCHLCYAVLRPARFIAQLNRPAQALYSHMLQRNIA